MKDFSTFDNTSGSFPSVVATNSSGPTLRDGTPVDANTINDIWGAFQAVLNAASVTPSGSVETSSASDLLDSIRKVSGAPGELVFHASPDETLDANVLPLKGQVITIASYPELVAATYVGDSYNSRWNAFIKTSDAGGTTPDTAGTYFVLPDCRGYFLRALAGAKTGVDIGRDYLQTLTGYDYRNASGELQGSSPGQHYHECKDNSTGYKTVKETHYVMVSDPGNITGSSATVTPVSRNVYLEGYTTTGLITGEGKDGSTDYSSDFYDEIRPINMGFQLGIRY